MPSDGRLGCGIAAPKFAEGFFYAACNWTERQPARGELTKTGRSTRVALRSSKLHALVSVDHK